MARSLTLLLIVVAFFHNAPAQRRSKKKPASRPTATHNERLSREAELKKLQREIKKTEAELHEHTRRENLTKRQLAERDAKNKALRATLIKLKVQAAKLQVKEATLDTSIKQTASTIDTLKQSYAADAIRKYTSGAYRTTVISGSGLDDPMIEADRKRIAYYSSIAASAIHQNKSALDSTKSSLTSDRDEVAAQLSTHLETITETADEQHSVEAERIKKAKELSVIQTKKAALQKELDKRKQSAKRLEAMISNLAAKEEAEIKRRKEALRKREAERKSKVKAGKKLTTQERHQETLDAVEVKSMVGPHSLGWPCSSHRVVQAFGEQRNKELGTVTMNLGIDIALSEGSSVHSAEKGTVALVSSLPSYGSLVIVRHGGGILTVYAGLESVSVSSGEQVAKGSTLGKSGTNSELGSILHFEVWKGRSKQNPIGWLK